MKNNKNIVPICRYRPFIRSHGGRSHWTAKGADGISADDNFKEYTATPEGLSAATAALTRLLKRSHAWEAMKENERFQYMIFEMLMHECADEWDDSIRYRPRETARRRDWWRFWQ